MAKSTPQARLHAAECLKLACHLDEGLREQLKQMRTPMKPTRHAFDGRARDENTSTMTLAELEKLIDRMVARAFEKQRGATTEDGERDTEALARGAGLVRSPGPLLTGRARDSGRRSSAHDSAIPRDYDFEILMQRVPS